MAARMIVELDGDKKLLIGGGGPEAGLAEVAIGDDIAKFAGERLEGALGTLGDLVGMLERSVGKMVKRPDTVQLEFGASLTADCDLWIVSGEGSAEFKVTLAWEKLAE